MKTKLRKLITGVVSIVVFLMMISFIHSIATFGVTIANDLTSQTTERLISGNIGY